MQAPDIERACPEIADHPFWQFSLACYAKPDVAPACLELQDRLGLDVNVLLFCCWAGSRGRALGNNEIDVLIATTRVWRAHVILPLRGARRWLKENAPGLDPAAESLREEVKACELAAEAIEQGMLFRAVPVAEGEPSPAAAAGNLRTYLSVLGRVPGAADTAALAAIVCACCPALTPLDAVRLLEG